MVEVCKGGGQVLWSNQRKWFQVVFSRRPAARYQARPVQFHQEEVSTRQIRKTNNRRRSLLASQTNLSFRCRFKAKQTEDPRKKPDSHQKGSDTSGAGKVSCLKFKVK